MTDTKKTHTTVAQDVEALRAVLNGQHAQTETHAEVLAEYNAIERPSPDDMQRALDRIERSLAAGKVTPLYDRELIAAMLYHLMAGGAQFSREEISKQASLLLESIKADGGIRAPTEPEVIGLVAGPAKWHHKMNEIQEREAEAFDRCREITIANIKTWFAVRNATKTAPLADPAKASGSAPDGLVMMPRASVQMLADIEPEDIDNPNGATWSRCPACGETAFGKWEAGKYQRPTIPHNSDCPAEAARKALATPPASAPEVTTEMVEAAHKGYYDAVGGIVSFKGMRAALTAALQEGKSHG